MRILLLGASGFIGRELFAALVARGHHVVAGVRDARQAPAFARQVAQIDLNRVVEPGHWTTHLEGMDAVVNCAGILYGTRRQSMRAIHVDAPSALVRACENQSVRRFVQISAISADAGAGTEYATSKRAGDDAVRASSLEWVVLRPSLVHARGAHGGTALFRALAALPFVIPVPASGGQRFQPIFIDDLAAVVIEALEGSRLVRQTIDPVGAQTVTLRELLEDCRRWLGLPPARVVSIPAAMTRMAGHLGNAFGGPLNSTSLAQLEYGNAGDYARFSAASGMTAAGWSDALAAHPSHTQDRWHARLYFARPLLRISLAFLWLASGAIGVLRVPQWAHQLAGTLSESAAAALLYAGCAIDVTLGGVLLARPAARGLAAAQASVVVAYTAAATLLAPHLWLDPLGPLVKNIPILAAIAALGAMERR